jgi:hypothetical protein
VANPTTILSAVSQKIVFIFIRNYQLFGDLFEEIRSTDSSNNIKEKKNDYCKDNRYFE